MAREPGFTVSFEVTGECLVAFVRGVHDTLDISKSFWQRIHSELVKSGKQRVLVEEDFQNQLTAVDMFRLAEFLAELFKGDVKVAHVDRRLSDMDLNRFGETVAINRGLRARVFNNRQEAERWLEE